MTLAHGSRGRSGSARLAFHARLAPLAARLTLRSLSLAALLPRRGPLVAAAALTAALAACGGGGASQGGAASPDSSGGGGGASAGTAAADFSARDIEGKTVHLSDYLGRQAILMDFWSTYCEPCLAEMPHLRKMYEANKAKGFVVIAVSMDGPETVAEVPSFAKRNGMVFPVLLDEDSHVASIYNPKKTAPLAILIDKSGKVVRVHEGYNPGDEEQLAKEVDAVLAPAAAAPAPSPSAAPATPATTPPKS